MSAKLFAFTGLLVFASALPSHLRSTLSERSPDRSDCWKSSPGSVFYNCANGYVGCFYSDPCSLPTRPSTTVPAPKPLERKEITKPRSYNILTKEASQNEGDRNDHVDLNKPEGDSITTTNAMVFDNVPKDAKNCRLMWRSVTRNDNNVFFVLGNGQAWVRQLNGFPTKKEGVSFNSLKKYQDPQAEWEPSLDFTGGPANPGTHDGPYVKCAEQIGLELKGSDQGEQHNRVFINISDTTGLYLTYEL